MNTSSTTHVFTLSHFRKKGPQCVQSFPLIHMSNTKRIRNEKNKRKINRQEKNIRKSGQNTKNKERNE